MPAATEEEIKAALSAMFREVPHGQTAGR